MLYCSPWVAFDETSLKAEVGLIKIPVDLAFIDGHLFCKQHIIEAVRPRAVEALESNGTWFEQLFTICDRETNSLLALEGKSDLSRFINQMVTTVNVINLLLFSDYALDPLLKKVAIDEGLTTDQLLTYMKPKKMTQAMEYEERLAAVDGVSEIDRLVEEYAWLGTKGFAGNPLTKVDVLATKHSVKATSQDRLDENNLSDRMKLIITIGSELAFQKSNVSEVINRVSFSYWPQLTELANQYGLTFNELTYLTHYELLDLLNGAGLPKSLDIRKSGYGVSYIDSQWHIYTGAEVAESVRQLLQTEISTISELRGMSAYPGKVVGIAKIVEKPDDINKIQEGDILIANETHPHYILGMRKAAAFVANFGGITSHTAILAREMQKPCVIGIKTATRVFRDGDQIEVDADQGIVRKLA